MKKQKRFGPKSCHSPIRPLMPEEHTGRIGPDSPTSKKKKSDAERLGIVLKGAAHPWTAPEDRHLLERTLCDNLPMMAPPGTPSLVFVMQRSRRAITSRMEQLSYRMRDYLQGRAGLRWVWKDGERTQRTGPLNYWDHLVIRSSLTECAEEWGAYRGGLGYVAALLGRTTDDLWRILERIAFRGRGAPKTIDTEKMPLEDLLRFARTALKNNRGGKTF